MGRSERTRTRTRPASWKRSPVRIDPAVCVSCDLCTRACPPELGAVARRGYEVRIVPELCSGCGACAPACPVFCIEDDPNWDPTPAAWWADVRMDVHA